MTDEEQRELDQIEGQFHQQKYDVDLVELKDGWGAAYHHRDSRIGSRTPHFGKTQLEAARRALAAFRDEQQTP
jgi:hypothetical protein